MLVILVFNDREVQNRIIQLERRYGPEELRRAANYLNEHLPQPLAEPGARGTAAPAARKRTRSINQVMLDAIAMAQQVVEAGRRARRASST